MSASATEAAETELDLSELEDATPDEKDVQLSVTGVPDSAQLLGIWKMLMYFMFFGFLSRPQITNQPQQSKEMRGNKA